MLRLEILLLVLVPLGLIVAGAAIVWAQSRWQTSGRSASSDRQGAVILAVGWTLLIVGIFAVVGLMANIIGWIVTAVILISLLYRFRSGERRSLLWMLMLAAERGIPLETAARAFAEERHDLIGSRALDLAEYLEAGLPLALALKRSRLTVPPSVLLSAELGQQTGDLGGALRQALGQNDAFEIVVRSAAERVFYLAFLLLFGIGVCTFLLVKIVPAFQKIFEDFGARLPPVTVCLVGVSNVIGQFWPLVLLLGVVVLAVLLRGLSYYTGSSPRYLPGITPSWHSVDRGVVMRWLAVAVRQNRPLADMMRLMAGYLTRRGLRRKMEWAAKRIEQGAVWTDCLRRAGLIRKAEAAVFESAERAGNLAWALDEMADSSVRRSAYRLRAAINVAFPAALVIAGGLVLFVAAAMLGPLFDLIAGLG
jgi:type II secretory pathway component PulF